MLFTDIKQKHKNVVYRDGYVHDDSLKAFRARLADAAIFVLDQQASAMAANVAFSRPSSIVSCLPFINQLPFPVMWIEFANTQVSQIMGKLGSENARRPDHVFFDRCGFLLRIENGVLLMDYVNRQKLEGTDTIADMVPIQGRFDVGRPSEAYALPAAFSSLFSGRTDSELIAKQSGKVRKQMQAIDRNFGEKAAEQELRMRFSAAPHPDHDQLWRSLGLHFPESMIAQKKEEFAADLYRFFTQQILPALILLNCRNAVDRELVEAPAKLNKARIAKGRPPIGEYHLVKMHLTPRKRRLYQSRGISTSISEGGVVIGHFKVRDSGIYWWNPHWRGPIGDGNPTRVTVITP
jgi:hypothetical protein